MRRFVFSVLAVLAAVLVTLGPALARATAPPPTAKGGLDCNGFSPLQTTFRQLWCPEIAANDENGFEDNGHYVGHDEPASDSSRSAADQPIA